MSVADRCPTNNIPRSSIYVHQEMRHGWQAKNNKIKICNYLISHLTLARPGPFFKLENVRGTPSWRLASMTRRNVKFIEKEAICASLQQYARATDINYAFIHQCASYKIPFTVHLFQLEAFTVFSLLILSSFLTPPAASRYIAQERVKENGGGG